MGAGPRFHHRNPVVRGLVERPEDWLWSSFLHYFAGADGVVEIESQWTARRRERLGIIPTVCVRTGKSPAQAELERGTLKIGLGPLLLVHESRSLRSASHPLRV
jgi:hypothetical protein